MRRTVQIQIEDRGNLKTFEIKEMSCFELEEWILRASRLLVGTGIFAGFDISQVSSSADAPRILAALIRQTDGLADLARKVDMDDFLRLRAQMLQTIALVTPSGVKMPLTRTTIEGNIEDYRTLLKLNWEALKFNLNFSSAGASTTSEPLTQTPSATKKPKISVRS